MGANGKIGDAKLGNLLSSTSLINAIEVTHGINSPPTYIRGKTTIDFIFVMPGVLKAIRRCGITAFTKQEGLEQNNQQGQKNLENEQQAIYAPRR
eukprot:11275223-Ditylum_brightwellii.AAC.1